MKNNRNSFIRKKRIVVYTFSFLAFILFSNNINAQQKTPNATINSKNKIVQEHASFTLKGSVFREIDNTTLPGASISVKNTTTGIETDIDGYFELKNVKPGDILSVRYLGCKSKNIIIGEKESFLKVYLSEDAFQLLGAVDSKSTYKSKRSFWQRVKTIF